MSTTSSKTVRKVASETAPPADKIAAARSTTSQRSTKSLREKVLTKAILSVVRKTPASEDPKLEAPEKIERACLDSKDVSPAGQSPVAPQSAEERVAAWARTSPPARPINSDDEGLLEDESVVSLPESATSGTQSVQGRPSFILTSSKRRAGVEMDMANKLANEMLQNGKEALEQAGNMKKECKTIALDSLQTMYETVLAISDSRARHKFNLEKERTRHAQELVRVERAHNKQLADLKKCLAAKLETASQDIEKTLKESTTIKDWLSYETRTPHSQIAETSQAVARLERTIKELTERVSLVTGEKSSHAEQEMHAEQKKMATGIDNISRQLDALRRETTELSSSTSQTQTVGARVMEILESRPQALAPPSAEGRSDWLEQEVSDLKASIKELRDEIHQKLTVALQAGTSTSNQTMELTQHLQPISERLEAVSSELRTMREQRQRTPPPERSLEAELAQVDDPKAKKPKLQTYAQIAAATPAPRPNHTLIVTATDPNKTGENIIESIRQALDNKDTAARVDRVRKARNQKVVLSCGTKEDLALVKHQVGANKGLKVEIAKTTNPLIKIKDVLAYHKDEQIVELLRAKNREIFAGIEKKDDLLRVRFRKRARNALECHPVLETSPVLHKKFIEAGMVYIGLQRRPVEDQSPLVQCARCLGYGHTKSVCREDTDLCSYCGGTHSWEKCHRRQEGNPPSCKNCIRAQNTSTSQAHAAYSTDCPERQKWDAIARSRVSYC